MFVKSLTPSDRPEKTHVERGPMDHHDAVVSAATFAAQCRRREQPLRRTNINFFPGSGQIGRLIQFALNELGPRPASTARRCSSLDLRLKVGMVASVELSCARARSE